MKHGVIRDALLLAAGASATLVCAWLRAQWRRGRAFAASPPATAPCCSRDLFCVRECTAADLSTLRELEQGVVAAERPLSPMIRADGVTYYDLEQLICEDTSRLLVVEESATGEAVATGYLSIRKSKPSKTHSHHGYLGFMFVVPRLRGQGLNRLVMDRLITWGQSQGVEHFYLDVYSDNVPAVRAYEKAGFSKLHYEMHAHLPK